MTVYTLTYKEVKISINSFIAIIRLIIIEFALSIMYIYINLLLYLNTRYAKNSKQINKCYLKDLSIINKNNIF